MGEEGTEFLRIGVMILRKSELEMQITLLVQAI